MNNTFAAMLAELNKGAVQADLGDKLTAAVAAVKMHGGKAKLKFTLTIKRVNDDALELSANSVVQVPIAPVKAAIFYADAEGRLSRDHPNQVDLPFPVIRTVTTPHATAAQA